MAAVRLRRPRKRKKSRRALPPEIQREVKRLRKAGFVVYFNADGSLGYAPKVHGAVKGHNVAPKYRRGC